MYNPQLKLLAYLKSKGIVAEAYSPLGSGKSGLLEDETAISIAKRHGLDVSHVLLGYLSKFLIRYRAPVSDWYTSSQERLRRPSQVDEEVQAPD